MEDQKSKGVHQTGRVDCSQKLLRNFTRLEVSELESFPRPETGKEKGYEKMVVQQKLLRSGSEDSQKYTKWKSDLQ
jgi:hypothetical protein